MLWILPLLLLLLLSTVVVLVGRSIVLLNWHVNRLLVATLPIVLLGSLVAVVLELPLVVGRLLLLHWLFLPKFGLTMRKTTLPFIRTLVLKEVLAKLGFIVRFALGVHVRSLLVLTIHTAAHLLLLALIIVVGSGLEGTLRVNASALVATSATTSHATSLLVLLVVLASRWLLLHNGLLGWELNGRGSIRHGWSSVRLGGLVEVLVHLRLAVASASALVGARHI